jgi:hypothetical protein
VPCALETATVPCGPATFTENVATEPPEYPGRYPSQPRSTPREQVRGDDRTERVKARGDRVDVGVIEQDVRRGVAEVDTHTQRPGETNLVTQLQRALERIGTRAGHVVDGTTGMEPLAGQPVAVQGNTPFRKVSLLLDPQRPVLTIHQTQLAVQTRTRGPPIALNNTAAANIPASSRLIIVMYF